MPERVQQTVEAGDASRSGAGALHDLNRARLPAVDRECPSYSSRRFRFGADYTVGLAQWLNIKCIQKSRDSELAHKIAEAIATANYEPGWNTLEFSPQAYGIRATIRVYKSQLADGIYGLRICISDFAPVSTASGIAPRANADVQLNSKKLPQTLAGIKLALERLAAADPPYATAVVSALVVSRRMARLLANLAFQDESKTVPPDREINLRLAPPGAPVPNMVSARNSMKLEREVVLNPKLYAAVFCE